MECCRQSVVGGIASISPNPEIVESCSEHESVRYGKGQDRGGGHRCFTKSGTNNFHGTGDYFFLNDALTSRTEFESTVPAYNRNEMGATFGGPILKDKLFGFGAIDVLRSSSINSYVTTVETQDLRNMSRVISHDRFLIFLTCSSRFLCDNGYRDSCSV